MNSKPFSKRAQRDTLIDNYRGISMSKHHVSHAFDNVMRDVRTMTTEDLQNHYGIELNKDGTIIDVCTERTFASTVTWAQFAAEEEDDADCTSFQRRHGKAHYDDEY